MHRVPVYRNDSSISLSSSSNSVQLHPGEHALSTLNLSTLNESSLPTAQIFSALNLPRNYPSVSPDIFSCFYQTSAPSSSPPIQTIRSSSSIRNSSPLSTAKSEKKEKREPRISLSLSFSIFLSLSPISSSFSPSRSRYVGRRQCTNNRRKGSQVARLTRATLTKRLGSSQGLGRNFVSKVPSRSTDRDIVER